MGVNKSSYFSSKPSTLHPCFVPFNCRLTGAGLFISMFVEHSSSLPWGCKMMIMLVSSFNCRCGKSKRLMYEHLKCFLWICQVIVITHILGNITREYLQTLGIAPKSSFCMEKLNQQYVSGCICHLFSLVRDLKDEVVPTHTYNNNQDLEPNTQVSYVSSWDLAHRFVSQVVLVWSFVPFLQPADTQDFCSQLRGGKISFILTYNFLFWYLFGVVGSYIASSPVFAWYSLLAHHKEPAGHCGERCEQHSSAVCSLHFLCSSEHTCRCAGWTWCTATPENYHLNAFSEAVSIL